MIFFTPFLLATKEMGFFTEMQNYDKTNNPATDDLLFLKITVDMRAKEIFNEQDKHDL